MAKKKATKATPRYQVPPTLTYQVTYRDGTPTRLVECHDMTSLSGAVGFERRPSKDEWLVFLAIPLDLVKDIELVPNAAVPA